MDLLFAGFYFCNSPYNIDLHFSFSAALAVVERVYTGKYIFQSNNGQLSCVIAMAALILQAAFTGVTGHNSAFRKLLSY